MPLFFLKLVHSTPHFIAPPPPQLVNDLYVSPFDKCQLSAVSACVAHQSVRLYNYTGNFQRHRRHCLSTRQYLALEARFFCDPHPVKSCAVSVATGNLARFVAMIASTQPQIKLWGWEQRKKKKKKTSEVWGGKKAKVNATHQLTYLWQPQKKKKILPCHCSKFSRISMSPKKKKKNRTFKAL